MSLLNKDFPHLHFQSSSLFADLLEYSPFETIHVHHNGQGHFCTSSSIGTTVHLYDSLNIIPTVPLMRQITSIYSPDETLPATFIVPIQSTQAGSVDCGIFALAYATDFAHGNNPSQIQYDQSQFRQHLLQCLQDHKVVPFPRVGMHPECSVPYEYTADIASTEKWSVPKRTSPTIVLEDCSDLIPTHNRFAPLLSQSSPEPPAAVTEPSVSDRTSTSNKQQSKSRNPVNLSRRVLSESELSLLD